MRKNLWGLSCILTASALLALSSCRSSKPDCLQAQGEESEAKVKHEEASLVESDTNPEAQQVESAIDVLDVQESEELQAAAAPVLEESTAETETVVESLDQPEEKQTASVPVLEESTAEVESADTLTDEVVNLEAVHPVEIVPQYETGE